MLLTNRIISSLCLSFCIAVGQHCVAQPTADQSNPVWRTITIGTFHSVVSLREALEAERCGSANRRNSANYRLVTAVRCALGNSANEIIGRPDFGLSGTRREIRLVVLSGKDLGFDPESQPSLQDIYERAESLGYLLCPPEVGPQLRLQYTNQKVGEFLHIAMRPLRDYDGEPTIFTVGNGGAGLLLVGSSGSPEIRVPATVQFVFAHSVPTSTLVRD